MRYVLYTARRHAPSLASPTYMSYVRTSGSEVVAFCLAKKGWIDAWIIVTHLSLWRGVHACISCLDQRARGHLLRTSSGSEGGHFAMPPIQQGRAVGL